VKGRRQLLEKAESLSCLGLSEVATRILNAFVRIVERRPELREAPFIRSRLPYRSRSEPIGIAESGQRRLGYPFCEILLDVRPGRSLLFRSVISLFAQRV
jgi:hypothetical protein